jgi:hypothetical protein
VEVGVAVSPSSGAARGAEAVRRLLLLAALVGGLAPAVRADEEPGPWDEVVFLPEKGLSVLLERDPKGVLLDRAT